MPMPEHLHGPDLWPDAAPLFAAFDELGSERQIGFATGPIPFRAIERYAANYGLSDPDDFDLLRRAIRALDSLFLERARERAEAQAKK